MSETKVVVEVFPVGDELITEIISSNLPEGIHSLSLTTYREYKCPCCGQEMKVIPTGEINNGPDNPV